MIDLLSLPKAFLSNLCFNYDKEMKKSGVKSVEKLPRGFYCGATRCGLKKTGLDLGFILAENVCQAAGVYTANQLAAAPIQISRQTLTNGRLQGLIVNAGNANAVTGKTDLQNAMEIQKLLAEKAGLAEDLIAVASTGVIGQPLPMEKIRSGINQLALTEQKLADFQAAILTTDTRKKTAAVELSLAGESVKIVGVAKGSGMIHPNMGTMLAFVMTDADLTADLAEKWLRQTTEKSFNQITIDGDTSTNDCCFLLASGASKIKIAAETKQGEIFYQALENVMVSLAKQIAADGEGATKLIEVHVVHADSEATANLIAKKIVGSTLVKAAMFGEDPNWGRILCAIGNVEETLDPTKINLQIGDFALLIDGTPVNFDRAAVKKYLANKEILIQVDVQGGDFSGRAWGCDLSYEYIKVNALYQT